MHDKLRRRAAVDAPGQVEFLGRHEDVVPLLWAADAMVLTSSSEGVPGVLIEAGLCGLPVVASDVGFVRDVVVPGETGYVVPPEDVDGFAAALERAVRERLALGGAARRHCVERFDLERVVDEWERLIRAVLGEGGAFAAESTVQGGEAACRQSDRA